MQTGTCTTPTGAQISFQVNDERGTESQALRVFAGLRLDPFFIDLQGVLATNKLRRLAFRPRGTNILEGQNVLSIVIEAEVAALFGTGSGSLFAVVGETLTTGNHPIRLERFGRPELKNVVLSPKEFDPVNPDLEIRDLYNQEDPFDLAKDYAGAYRARLNANLAFFDGLDDKIDWPLDEQGNHPLTELLLADYMVVDVSKPYAEESCYEIERALIAGRAHATCGGRSLNDDIVDSLYTLLVNAGNGPRIRDGVDQATQPASHSFPYLVRPNPNPAGFEGPSRRAVGPTKGGGAMIDMTNDCGLSTTSGVIALVNLQAQIDGLEAQAAVGRLAMAQRADLIDLLILRGHVLGRIADYERAAALAEQLVREAPADGSAFLARARTRATFHRFAEALTDLDAAERLGADRAALQAERAAILQALGRYDDALAFRRNAAERRPDFATLGALAGLQAERGEVVEAERLFAEARRRYQSVSPFPLAMLDFQRGLMWLEQGDLHTARLWFEAAQRRVPTYAPALGHLAEVDAALGEREAAIARLRPLAASSDDPEYAAQLAGVLSEAGQAQEAHQWRAKAAARYDELIARHPAAFADHAAEFWLTIGANRGRALHLAHQNFAIRQTARAYALLQRASLATAST